MRKFISFLALLVIAFALPGRALAADFSSGTDPEAISIEFRAGTVSPFALTFKNGVWTGEFVSIDTYVNFKVKCTWPNNGGTGEFGDNVGASTPGNWVAQPNWSNNEFYQLGLEKGARYRFDLKAKDDDTNMFQWCITKIGSAARGKLYIYEAVQNPVKLKEATEDNEGNYTFNIHLEQGQNFVLSKNNSTTTNTSWDTVQNDSGRFNPKNKDVDIPGENIAFEVYDGSNNKNGCWHATMTGDYTITVNWSAKTLTATCEGGVVDGPSALYLYSTDGPKFLVGAAKGEGGIYNFDVKLTAGQEFVVGTVGDAQDNWNYLNKNRYSPESKSVVDITDIPQGMLKFEDDEKTPGAWIAPWEGPYTVIVDWGQKKIHAIFKGTTNINLPLTSADFKNADGSARKHYFIVGERMGEWHLQPEWELQRVGNALELDGRLFYRGAFAIAVVDNYTDYTRHRYTYYGKTYNFKSTALSCGDFANTGKRHENYKTEAFWANPGNVFYAEWDGDYSEGKGKFISKVKVTLDGNGNPQSITMTEGTAEEDAKNRMFTLVGDKIYNDNYCNSADGPQTTMYTRGYYTGQGWQEGWIQFDPTDHKPYVDGNGQYLYHTSFTPDYLLANPVYFNQQLPNNGGDFSFLSNATQFIEYTKLPDLENDPYLDFYKSFSGGKETIKGGLSKNGNGYNFKTNLVNENNTTGVTPSANWSCYVVRDMWISGEIKFWSGWGGNTNLTNNGDENKGAAWHGENGGPQIDKHKRQDVVGGDINAGTTVNLYKNGRNIDDANYVISDGTPVYFNRVVLWYNPTDGVDGSFIQFIQESSSPAIFAKVTKNTKDNKDNFITYNWYLSAALNDMDAEKEVSAYEVRRYKVVDGADTYIGLPEGGKVQLPEGVKMKDLYQSEAAKKSYTKFEDTGTVAGKGFSAGVYKYDIYVYFADGSSKRAASNTVAIYDDALVTPMAVALQVVELRDAYTGVSGEEIASGVKYFGADNTRRYLTYSPDNNAPYFLFDEREVSVNGVTGETTIVPMNPKKVDSAKARDFLRNHPEMYMWTSNFYVRCLDYSAYRNTMQSWIDNGLVNETSVPYPVLSVQEYVEISDDNGNKIKTEVKDRGYAGYFKFADDDDNSDNDKEYMAMLVKRGGNLADGNFEVTLNVKYNDADNTTHTITSTEATSFDPVIPRPYKPLYRYTYAHPKGQTFDTKWGKLMVPAQNWRGNDPEYANATTTQYLEKGWVKDVYVDLEDDTFNPRELILQLDFTRPNVADEIYLYYDIQYKLKIENNADSVPMDIDVVLHDLETQDVDKDGKPDHIPNRYRIELSGIHPRNTVWPIITFVDTEYHPNMDSKDHTDWTYVKQPANYGTNYKIEAKSRITIKEPGKLDKVHLGFIKRADGTYDWMYKGHEEFSEDPDILGPEHPDDAYEFEDYDTAKKYEMNPVWYLFEFKTETDSYTYDYLVPHYADHTKGQQWDPVTGLSNPDIDPDPLIGCYVAKGFKTADIPTVYATAMYVFNRELDPSGKNPGISFGDLEVVFINNDANPEEETPAAAPKRERRKAPTNADLEKGGAGKYNDAGVLPDESEVTNLSDDNNNTGYNDFISLKGATAINTPSDDTVTAVEVVVFEGVEGEVIYYDMKGIRLQGEPTTPGVYIRAEGENFTKFIVK